MEASNAGNAVMPEKKRYEWIDNARIVAALLIIYGHMPQFFYFEPSINNSVAYDLVHATAFYGRVPFFLILGGYFLGRRITWEKAFDRALWLLIPFFLWNLIYYSLVVLPKATEFHFWPDLLGMLGMTALFVPDFHLPGIEASAPCIGVSWFLRDIVFLSLLTPLLVRYRYYMGMALILMVSYIPCNVLTDSHSILAPATCFYYVLGTCLSDFRISDAYRILNKKFTPYLCVGLVAAVACSLCATLNGYAPMPVTLLGSVFGALMIAQCGVLVETYMPKFSKILAPCGPACFLVFMLQEPLMSHLVWRLPHWFIQSWLVWLLPFAVCTFLIILFLLMKRYTPWLLPYLGHMKIAKQEQKAS